MEAISADLKPDVQSLYPFLRIRPLTTQQERFVNAFVAGNSLKAAAAAAGCAVGTAQRWMASDEIKAVIAYLRQQTMGKVQVTRDKLNMMLFEAHRKAITATEEIQAIRELGKLNGLYEPEVHKIEKKTHLTIERYEELSDEELLEILDESPDRLLPSPEEDDGLLPGV